MPLSRLRLLPTALPLPHPAAGTEKAGREEQHLLKGTVTAEIIKKCKLTQVGKPERDSVQKGITEPQQATNATTRQSQRHLHGHRHNRPPQDSYREPDALSGITLPQVGIKIPRLSSQEEKEQVQHGDIKQRMNWAIFGLVWLVFNALSYLLLFAFALLFF